MARSRGGGAIRSALGRRSSGLSREQCPHRTNEPQEPEAQLAVNKDYMSVVGKGVFGPTKLHDWPEVR